MKRQLPLLLIFAFGAFMVVQYFIPHEGSEFFYEFVALDWPPIVGVFALSLGTISLIRVSIGKVQRRDQNWGYTLVTLAGIASMLIAGLPWFGGQRSPMVLWEFNNIMLPVTASMFAILAFFIASAAYRAFRARSALATLLLVSAVIVMMRFFPLGPLTEATGATADWILNVPNLAAKRAILIGVGLGIVSTALKIILGVERSYLGRD
jgi:hypothetical protein